jgi:hypothetical protein
MKRSTPRPWGSLTEHNARSRKATRTSGMRSKGTKGVVYSQMSKIAQLTFLPLGG